MLIHSTVYYCFNENIVSDHQWARWAQELAEAQGRFPGIAEKEIWAEAFQNFDPSTGFNLPIKDPWVVGWAQRLLHYHEKIKENKK